MSTHIYVTDFIGEDKWYYMHMTFHAKNLLFVSLVVGVVFVLIGIAVSFVIKTTPTQQVVVPENVSLPADFTPKVLRESILGTVLDTEAKYGLITIIDASGVEKAVTISTTTRILQTVIQYTQEGEEVRRIEREVNIADVHTGTEIEISAYIEREGGLVDTVRFTSSTTIDLLEYLKIGESKNGFLYGEVTEYEAETGVLMLKQISVDGVLATKSSPVLLVPEMVMVYELRDALRPLIFHTQTPKMLSDIEVGDIVRVFIRPDEVTQRRSVYAILITPTV